ncbi:diguanylate cyclase (GGDEF)-like protein [Tepidamorphus gemmatus]|uniref:diguanylate cyclase n=1 Tax=Tepidamorphus gemmatus TaxID=747076 RepID=A0A4R3MGB2_9HYPH|nr:GGDEF domain-containing protein [Tepidamorphus gemmatus]TCT11347.1 diguanylate cyclase (GGDEF)-like protein [Tepidamorphus gemmatus]
MPYPDVALLALQLVFYVCVMTLLFGLRHRYGIGIFFCALGAMHFLETYLAATFYVAVPGGFLVSPGSTILFAGKIVLLLLVYIREDATAVRQPIYGLFAGNLLMIGLVAILRHTGHVAGIGPNPDFLFMDQMGLLMLWGTVLLLADGILIILIYERIGRWFGRHVTLRIAVSGVAVLTFDQFLFWPVLHMVTGVPLVTLLSGWVAKSTTAVACALLVGAYLRFVEKRMFDGLNHPRLGDVFDALTYRQRYECLLEASGRDGLTGVGDRGRMERECEREIARTLARSLPVSVLLIDIDNFKMVNDQYGHIAGDALLRSLAAMLQANLRESDQVYRFGGDEFVVVGLGIGVSGAMRLAERLLREASELRFAGGHGPATISIGVATAPDDGRTFVALLSRADSQLYAAKQDGRNRIATAAGTWSPTGPDSRQPRPT